MPTHWNRASLIAAAFVVAFLAFQLAVPVIGLFRDRPASFSWHMYSAYKRLPEVLTVDRSGAEVVVDVSRMLASRRAEVDYTAAVVASLCQSEEVVAVKVRDPASGASEVTACR